MKRSVDALVILAAAAVSLAAATPGAHAVSPVVTLEADVWRSPTASGDGHPKLRVTASFSTDPPGAELLTLQRAVVFFPDRAATNGRLFPSCSAARIGRFRGDVRRCPRASRIGSGTVTARAPQLDVTATARVAVFNSHRGERVTFNFRTLNPVAINESFDAPLTQLNGVYGEKLTLVVPHSLQEILSGVFVGVRRFEVTIAGAVHVRGVEHPFLRARVCPPRPMRGVFDFMDWTTGQTATTTVDARLRCRLR